MREDALDMLSRLPFINGVVEPAGMCSSRPDESTGESRTGLEPNAALTHLGTRYECFLDGESACIVRCPSSASELTVPDSVEGLPVTAIAPHAFSTCYELERTKLPDTVTSIGGYAFMNTALASFDAPPALRVLGAFAFYKCTRLERVDLHEGLESIGEGAFRESALERLDIPSTVVSIGHSAFKSTALSFAGPSPTLRILGDNPIFRLESGALYRETPDGLELAQVLDETIVDYEAPDGLVRIDGNAFANLKRLAHARLPEGVVSIGDAAFKGCANLKSVKLPDSLRTIGKQAFNDTALESLRIPASLESAGAAAFYTGGTVASRFERTIRRIETDERNTRFYMERGILCWRDDDGRSVALLYIGDDEHVVIPRDITAIGPYAFLKARNTRRLTLHDGIEFIDVGGLDFGRGVSAVEYLTYEGEDHPVRRYVIAYPPGEAGWQASRQTFSRGYFNLAYAYAAADNAILITQDTFNRSKAILERLGKPIELDKRMQAEFERKIERTLTSTVVAFGRNGFPQGIDLLHDFGFLNRDTIDVAIEAASDTGEIAVLSRLMEIKRTSFDAPLFDFDL